VNKLQTALQNAKAAVSGVPENVRQYFEISEQFRPEVVVSDFDTFAYLYGKNWMLPVISIDNMQVINRCRPRRGDHQGARGRLPAHQEHRQGQAARLLPLPRHHVLLPRGPQGPHHPAAVDPAAGDPRGPEREGRAPARLPDLDQQQGAPEILARSGHRCRIYGLRRDLKEPLVDGPLTYAPFSEMASSRTCAPARRWSPTAASR
jgi:hypothetical protein